MVIGAECTWFLGGKSLGLSASVAWVFVKRGLQTFLCLVNWFGIFLIVTISFGSVCCLALMVLSLLSWIFLRSVALRFGMLFLKPVILSVKGLLGELVLVTCHFGMIIGVVWLLFARWSPMCIYRILLYK